MEFPVYRKINNDKSYYKIISNLEFIEIQIIGKSHFKNHFRISHYPDKLFLLDVISGKPPYEIANQEEVERLLII
ncbi:MAG TPA: hypothetical protein DEF82_04470 [Crocinitomicaceae bacterium]|nr:hypothetical protein [Flavobacteriales bacterium]HBW86005.1 hypothetical protein [Crocinitomicaceae bacterium]